ncbi:MAG TPA: hypothetical protein VEQ60_13700 [Longimicrobium sp.]|nr:hypothetical protein [Longimicrobium sp.]
MIAVEHQAPSPMRFLEMLSDRFGAFEAVAESTIKLARFVPADEIPMDSHLAEAVMEFACDLRSAAAASGDWARSNGFTLAARPNDAAAAE